jgi:hypothetical protein
LARDMMLLLVARLSGVSVRQYDYPCSGAIYHLYIPVPSPTASRMCAQAAEILEQANELERRTKDTPAWYAGTRAKVEGRAALEQAEELRRVLEHLGKRLG